MNWQDLDITINGLKKHYRNDDFTPSELVSHLLEKSRRHEKKNIWITLLTQSQLTPYLSALEKLDSSLPLYGIPFAIKDNIDIANIPTTAACKDYRYTPQENAFVVNELIMAGAIPIGKTNMDQFATGLVGTRSPEPWGPCKNAFNDDYISGGSSSGSAVATSLGLVSFALGTDTAGSGRVPAAFNNLVGMKPTKGLLSTTGIVPACRSLDVVSIFALNAEDAKTVFDVATVYDGQDAFARPNPFYNSQRATGIGEGNLLIGIPTTDQLTFFGDSRIKKDFECSLDMWRTLGAEVVKIDFQPFLHAAKLLYEGPWVTERFIATKNVLKRNPESIHPVVREIIASGELNSAEAVFSSQYKLQGLKKQADLQLHGVDFIMTPTTAKEPTIAEALERPVTLNNELGYYTNFMNLLDYSAIALPYARHRTIIPNGFTLVGKTFDDQKLLAWGKRWLGETETGFGTMNSACSTTEQPQFRDPKMTNIVVCGAHLDGQPLNWQLVERGARKRATTTSAPHYRLYALPDGKRPGVERNSPNGVSIEVEVWEMPSENFGSFVAAIPAPLGIGKIELQDGTWESGFICEAYGLEDALDISQHGGWRAYLDSRTN